MNEKLGSVSLVGQFVKWLFYHKPFQINITLFHHENIINNGPITALN